MTEPGQRRGAEASLSELVAEAQAENKGTQPDGDRTRHRSGIVSPVQDLRQSKDRDHCGLLTPEEAADWLKVSAEHVRALIRTGRLTAINVGTGPKRPLYRISVRALDEFLSSRHQPAHATRQRRFKRLPPVADHFPHLR